MKRGIKNRENDRDFVDTQDIEYLHEFCTEKSRSGQSLMTHQHEPTTTAWEVSLKTPKTVLIECKQLRQELEYLLGDIICMEHKCGRHVTGLCTCESPLLCWKHLEICRLRSASRCPHCTSQLPQPFRTLRQVCRNRHGASRDPHTSSSIHNKVGTLPETCHRLSGA